MSPAAAPHAPFAGSVALDVPRRATGTIETYQWADGRTVTFRLRIPAYGARHRVDLGTNHEGWNHERAQVELERIMGQVERGTWVAPERNQSKTQIADVAETVQVTASRWWQRRQTELAPTTRADYRWRLDYVLAALGRAATAQLDVRQVDEFRARLQAHGLSARSVNMVLDLLAQVLDDAIDYRLLELNPARGKRRRMKVPKSRRTFLEPDMVVDLLDVAAAWEAGLPPHQRYGRRALLATLCLAGPRISELTGAPRGRLDVHGGRLRVGEAKTEAGLRDLELTAFLLDEIRGHLAAIPDRLRDRGPGLPLFPTWPGGRLQASNVRNRLLNGTPARPGKKPTKGVVQRANEKRAGEGKMQLPDRVTPHTLRRTFASLALAAGRDPRWVMGQLGHTDARLTLNVYAQIMQRQRLDRDLIWRLMRFPDEPDDKPGSRRHEASGAVTDGQEVPDGR